MPHLFFPILYFNVDSNDLVFSIHKGNWGGGGVNAYFEKLLPGSDDCNISCTTTSLGQPIKRLLLLHLWMSGIKCQLIRMLYCCGMISLFCSASLYVLILLRSYFSSSFRLLYIKLPDAWIKYCVCLCSADGNLFFLVIYGNSSFMARQTVTNSFVGTF